MTTSTTVNPADHNFTLEKFCVVMGELGRLPPVLIAIVAQPVVVQTIRDLISRGGMDRIVPFGVEVYADDQQEAMWIPFYDRALLTKYLNRNEKPICTNNSI